MATLVAAAGAAPGGSAAAGRLSLSRRDAFGRRDRLADRRAGGVIRRPMRLFGSERRQAVVEGPRLAESARHGLDGRRADPARLWPRAARRSGDLGRHSSRSSVVTTSGAAAAAKGLRGGRARQRGRTSIAITPTSPWRSAKARSRARPGLGRRTRARSRALHFTGSTRAAKIRPPTA